MDGMTGHGLRADPPGEAVDGAADGGAGAIPAPRGDGLAWRVWNTVQFAFTLAWTAGWITLALLVRPFSGPGARLPLRMAARCWAPGLLWGAGARLQVEGRERIDFSRPCLFVANHQSVIDICALFRAIPVPLRFLLKQEMKRVPFVGWYACATGMLFIVRDSARAGALFRRQAAALLADGQSLCLFPEGTRSRDGTMVPFKAGSLQSAIDAGVDVVPVALHGAGRVLPVDGFFRVRPGTIRVGFGAPLRTRVDGRPVSRQLLAEQAQARVQAILDGWE
ncbi:lysophospholipid acyltransferase family protein [Luteimonas composti]|uniref:1-acyl-sn-glycerol-3-phosphate acyltransferase n=1 Tax=Luteimonas composti TaxID=398257 RepID=A0ABT6MUH2_9GAMM|nr:lysophospholipid acyltransferase family protein [Luteimonas composti]MDH7453748.1 lysophospholipid acyltransferase family protein [Luteimonas composti]